MHVPEQTPKLPLMEGDLGISTAASTLATKETTENSLEKIPGMERQMPPVHPFRFDAHRAVRLALRYGRKALARELLVRLCVFEQAIAVSDTFHEDMQVVSQV